MSFSPDIYQSIDAHFAEENSCFVSFPNRVDLGAIAFAGSPQSAKYKMLGLISDRFHRTPGQFETEKVEIQDVMIKLQLIDIIDPASDSFDKCQAVVVIIEGPELPRDMLYQIKRSVERISLQPQFHVFSAPERLQGEISMILNSPVFHASYLDIHNIVTSLLPKKDQISEALDNFAKSLSLETAVLIDVHTRLIFGSNRALTEDEIDNLEAGVDMFINVATMMDGKDAQSVSSVEIEGDFHLNYFWNAFDVIVGGISKAHIPSETAKNNTIALLHIIRTYMQ